MIFNKEIFTENPEQEQWQMLLRFAYPANIEKFLREKESITYDQDFLESIAGSISQANEYFNASNSVSLNTLPVLLYYGTTNLLFGVSSLISRKKVIVESHGMKVKPLPRELKRIADIEVQTYNQNTGGLYQFYQILEKEHELPFGTSWTLLEILSAIPELSFEFENCYSGEKSCVIPTEKVKLKNNGYLERIEIQTINKYEGAENIFRKIENFDNSYLSPQTTNNYVILRKKLFSKKELGIYSISGQKYFQLGHVKGKNW